MGILEQLPQGLVTFLTWLVVWGTGCILILVIAIFIGRFFGEFLDGVMDWFK